jgi:hypothetical protein
MPETQDKIGHLYKDVPNNTKRGGREVPDTPQDKIGWQHTQNKNDKPSGGSFADQNTSHGFREAVRSEPKVRRANDHVKKIADEY